MSERGPYTTRQLGCNFIALGLGIMIAVVLIFVFPPLGIVLTVLLVLGAIGLVVGAVKRGVKP